MVRYPLATVATVFLVILAIILLTVGKRFQIGGILGMLWGKKSDTTPDLKVVPPPDRKDEKGETIQPGQSDDKGFVQVPVQVEIEEPWMFSDPNKITVVHPKRGKEVIELPTGVTNDDVKEIIEISPKTYQIKNNDKGVDAGKLLDELNK